MPKMPKIALIFIHRKETLYIYCKVFFLRFIGPVMMTVFSSEIPFSPLLPNGNGWRNFQAWPPSTKDSVEERLSKPPATSKTKNENN